MSIKQRPDLSETDAKVPYADYYCRESAAIPQTVLDGIQKSPYPEKDALLLENINDLLNPGYSPLENGYCDLSDGTVFVAVRTEMPNVSGDMLDWWFWWHSIDGLRYKIWYPQAHFGISVDADADEYKRRQGSYRERYWNTTHYPIEDVGTGSETLTIHFVPPHDFGFHTSEFEEAGVSTVACGIVGSVSQKIRQYAHMCHFVRKTEDGVEMRSRFWIGHTILKNSASKGSIINRLINTRIVKKILLPKNIGSKMAMHCTQEYNNLAAILPELYSTYGKNAAS